MKVSKKTGIALFVTAAVIMAVLIVFHKNPGPAADPGQELAKKIISCVVIAAACVAFIHWYDKFTGLPVELFQNRHLIWKLAKNDFKKRYAGSYLGAFQQETIKEVICLQADFEYENADEINTILSGYSINTVSAQFGSSWNVYQDKGVAMKKDVYALLAQTGLCCRLAR